jgi:AcrR family transcriptional regulator
MSAASEKPPAGGQEIGGFRHGRVPRELREQQLLDVAEEVFTELGYDGASIEEVSRRSGVKRPLFYTYFGGKEGLYLACYRRARHQLDEQLAGAGAAIVAAGEVSGAEGLRAIVGGMSHAYFEFLASSKASWEMLYGPGAAIAGPIAEEVAQLRRDTVQLLADVLRNYADPAIDDKTVLAFAHAASGAAEQLAHWWRHAPELTLEQLKDTASRFTWAGLAQVLPADA